MLLSFFDPKLLEKKMKTLFMGAGKECPNGRLQFASDPECLPKKPSKKIINRPHILTCTEIRNHGGGGGVEGGGWRVEHRG